MLNWIFTLMYARQAGEAKLVTLRQVVIGSTYGFRLITPLLSLVLVKVAKDPKEVFVSLCEDSEPSMENIHHC
ncbi:hypothetical protein E2C01_023087 [Portunus trituberculatus]|uniref:Uncharacterized protein n=1 Tax=Portunus trituberculatus TaxID=210409 RepID=A0A5B7E9G8_PORTR|nr:hypothetical protein [Portunus trituberculatus]